MRRATSENCFMIRHIFSMNHDLRQANYSPNFLFEILLGSHSYFNRIDQFEILIDFQKTS
jgi:hypothetical protein